MAVLGQSDEAQASKLVDKGTQAFMARQYSDALTHYRSAFKLHRTQETALCIVTAYLNTPGASTTQAVTDMNAWLALHRESRQAHSDDALLEKAGELMKGIEKLATNQETKLRDKDEQIRKILQSTTIRVQALERDLALERSKVRTTEEQLKKDQLLLQQGKLQLDKDRMQFLRETKKAGQLEGPLKNGPPPGP
ncbi:hypothetical protein [Myxococcus stipitatus]|nr:hypothetical protein [Myxococcus stipitatus]